MKLRKNLPWIIIMVIGIIILVITAYILNLNKSNIESVVINRKYNDNYETMIIKDYDAYQEFLQNYNILGKYEKNDFKKNDLIIDFIPYQENMKINQININMNEGIVLTYETFPKIENEDSEKILVNFIPIKKDMIGIDEKIIKEYK